jgi:uncharacterized protein (TIGR00266 family)
MKSEILGKPSFAYVHIDLEPGESITAESDAMSSMSNELSMKAHFNGGFFSGLIKKFLGSESLFVNTFTNNSQGAQRLSIVQATPGDINEIEMDGSTVYLQPGAYIASTPGLKLGVKWAGFASFIGREGLFRLVVTGTGSLWYGAYGGLIEKEIDGEYIVDTGHLVTYDPQIKLKVQFAGGIFSSLFGGEGLVTRLEGKGKIIMQTRSMGGLASWVNTKI